MTTAAFFRAPHRRVPDGGRIIFGVLRLALSPSPLDSRFPPKPFRVEATQRMSSGFIHDVNQLFCCPPGTDLFKAGSAAIRVAQQLGDGSNVGVGQVGSGQS
jgi:hypothetical protein